MSHNTWAAEHMPRLVQDVYVKRKTGALRLRRGDERHGIHFQTGRIVHAETSIEEQNLVKILSRRDGLAPPDLDSALETARTTERALTAVLIERRLADHKLIGDALTEIVRASFQRIARWSDGLCAFDEDEQAAVRVDGDALPAVHTGDLILEFIRALPGRESMRSVVDNLDALLIPSTDPLLRFQKVQLSPSEGYAFSRVDGTSSAREILQIIPAEEEEAARTLVALVCLGLIEELPVLRPPKVDASSQPAPVPSRSESGRSAESGSRPASNDLPSTKARDQRRREIIATFEGLKDMNHFELLRLPRSATESQIKEAYFRLAKTFHPDAHSDPGLSDLSDKLEAIFVRLGEAYETIRDPRRRASYETRLAPEKPASVAQTAPQYQPPPPPPPPPPNPAALLKDARKLFKDEKYWDAIQILERLLTQAKVKVEARLLLAQAYLKNPHWTKRAEEQLLLAVEEDAKSVEAHFLLGTLYLEKGIRTRAIGRFRKVLELDPKHEGAAAQLSDLDPPQSEAPPSEGGLFRRILKKD